MRVKITKIKYMFYSDEYFQIKFLTIKTIDFIKKVFQEFLINIVLNVGTFAPVLFKKKMRVRLHIFF